ncbi:MAG: glucose-6-phosphate dehydrogenase, partial [Candidatus Binatia bacterium]
MESPNRVKASVTSRTGEAGPGYEAIRVRDPFVVVIFGASGDLSKRKLVPALYHLDRAGYLPERFAVVGFSRTEMSDEQFRDGMLAEIRESVKDGGAEVSADNRLVRALHYQPGNADQPESFRRLRERLEALEKELDLPGNRLFYLSVAPEFFSTIVENLDGAGMIQERSDPTW